MTHLNIQQSSNVEIVGASLIQKLYETALATQDTTLAGNLLCEHCKLAAYEYLMGNVEGTTRRFPDLNINVTNGLYLTFADPEVESVLSSQGWGDGVGITLLNTQSKSSIGGFNQNENIHTFNELGLMSTITSLTDNAFNQSNIEQIDLSNIRTVGYRSLRGNRLSSINLPNVTSIGNEAMQWNSYLTSVTFGDSLTSIGTGALNNNQALTSVVLGSGLTSLPNNCFEYDTELSSIDISHITTIGSNAFYGCTKLENIDLSHVSTINNWAFCNCTSLTTIDLSSITYIGTANPFNGCNPRVITFTETAKDLTADIFNVNNSASVTTVNLVNAENWTKLNFRVFPILRTNLIFDVLNFKSAYQLSDNGWGLMSYGSGSVGVPQMYVPSVTEASIRFHSYYKRHTPYFGTLAQEYLNNNARKKINLLYFKNITTLPDNCFGGLVCNALVINNPTPPTCTKTYYAELSEYRVTAFDVYLDTWGNLENATDSTADILYSSGYSGVWYSDKMVYVKPDIDYIYVPDSAVSTYQSATGWEPVANKIKGISELNGGVKYATKADWVTAGKPLALIEEYM